MTDGVPRATAGEPGHGYYGQPLLKGADWGNIAIMLVATAVLAAVSVVGFERRDIAKQ